MAFEYQYGIPPDLLLDCCCVAPPALLCIACILELLRLPEMTGEVGAEHEVRTAMSYKYIPERIIPIGIRSPDANSEDSNDVGEVERDE